MNELLQQAMIADAAMAAKHQAEVDDLIKGFNALEVSYAHSTNDWQATKTALLAEIELLKARPVTLRPKVSKVPKAAKGKGELKTEQVSNELRSMANMYNRKWVACNKEWKVLMSKGFTKDEAKAQAPFTPTKDELAGSAAVRNYYFRARKQQRRAAAAAAAQMA
jgi:hypothetical protein